MATGRAIQRMGEGVWRLRLRGIEPAGVNAYLLAGEPVTLIDAGMAWDAPRLRRALRSVGYRVADVGQVLLTHFDVDHVGGLLRLGDLEAPVYLGRADHAILTGRATPPWRAPKGWLHRALRRVVSLPAPLEAIADGRTLGGLRAYHTPGHNPGHMAYFAPDRGFLAVGDLMRVSGGTLRPMFRFDSYDLARSKRSIRDLAARLPANAIERIGPGHGRPIQSDAAATLRRFAATV